MPKFSQTKLLQGITRCEEEIRAISYGILHLELEHEIGKINDETYKSAFAMLQENLKRTSSREKRLGNMQRPNSQTYYSAMLHKYPEPKLPEQKTKVYVEPAARSHLNFQNPLL